EKLVSLTSAPQSNEQQKATHKLSIAYDDLHFQAYVRSEALPLPLEDHYARVALEGGVKPEAPGNPFSQRLEQRVIVPGKGNKFRVEEATVQIARRPNGDPHQL